MIDCGPTSLHLVDYYTSACLLLVWKTNLTMVLYRSFIYYVKHVMYAVCKYIF